MRVLSHLGGLALAVALSSPAHAAPQKRGWEGTPYFAPILSGGGVLVNGQTVVQTQIGGEVGYRYRYRKPRPHVVGRTRARAVGIYATTGSLGADVRLGSFMGPDWKVVQLLHGPDFWFDVYGSPRAPDYHLPPTVGVDLLNQVTVRIIQGQLNWVTAVSPGWVSNRQRRAPQLGPFHTMTARTAMVLRTDFGTLQLGVQRQWTSAGPVNGLILSGSL